MMGWKPRPKDEGTILKGRFVAQAQNNLEDVGSFIGYSQLYVFQIENLYGHPELVKVSYTFRTIKDQLSSEYLDYSVVHSYLSFAPLVSAVLFWLSFLPSSPLPPTSLRG